jgi:hypothetical protein
MPAFRVRERPARRKEARRVWPGARTPLGATEKGFRGGGKARANNKRGCVGPSPPPEKVNGMMQGSGAMLNQARVGKDE